MVRELVQLQYCVAVWDVRFGVEFDLSSTAAADTLRGWITEGRVRGLILCWPFRRPPAIVAASGPVPVAPADIFEARACAVDHSVCCALDACWHSQTPVIVIRRHDPQQKVSDRFHSICKRSLVRSCFTDSCRWGVRFPVQWAIVSIWVDLEDVMSSNNCVSNNKFWSTRNIPQHVFIPPPRLGVCLSRALDNGIMRQSICSVNNTILK